MWNVLNRPDIRAGLWRNIKYDTGFETIYYNNDCQPADCGSVYCLECGAAPCEKAAQCRTLGMWTELHNMSTGYLDRVTLADLMRAETADHYII